MNLILKKGPFLIFLLALFPLKSFAGDEVINQLNFFYGQRSISPKEVNSVAKTAGFDEFNKLDVFGFEADRDLAPHVNVGVRLSMRYAHKNPTVASASGDYSASLVQTNFSMMLNAPLVKTERFQAGLFGGFGLGGTTFSLKNATQDGKFTNEQSGPNAMIGASVAFGYKYVFLKIEGGYEYDNVGSLKKVGTLTSDVGNIDLSGSYIQVGILVDGLKLGRM